MIPQIGVEGKSACSHCDTGRVALGEHGQCALTGVSDTLGLGLQLPGHPEFIPIAESSPGPMLLTYTCSLP